MNNEVLNIDSLINSRVEDSLAIPVLAEIKTLCEKEKIKIVVLDDDPTGTQTVYDLPVITKWHKTLIADTLRTCLQGFFILTNTRSLSEKEAVGINVLIAQNLRAGAKDSGCSVLLLSRSDSTLRGHFPAELLALERGWGAPWDGYILMPYFKEGGRYTIGDTHYLNVNNQLIPVAKTSFARDPVFGYASSNLVQYIWEKTRRQVNISEIISITTGQLNNGIKDTIKQLDKLHHGKYAVVNATCSYHAAVFALAFIKQWQTGRRWLVRCSASLVQAFFGIVQSKILNAGSIIANNNSSGGLIVVGSFVNQTTLQLQHIMANTEIKAFEIDVLQLSGEKTHEYVKEIADLLNANIRGGISVILYTSRTLIAPEDPAGFFDTGNKVSAAIVSAIKQLACEPRFLAAKGGITSSDIATKALGVEKAIVSGQLLPGVPVWKLGAESKFPGMSYIIIPGNVGTEDYLTTLYNKLAEFITRN